MLRRAAPWGVAIAAAALLLSYYIHSRSLVSELRSHSQQASVLYATVYRALSDTSAAGQKDADLVLFEMSQHILELGVPTVVTDASGAPVLCVNLPYCDTDDARVRAAVSRFERDGDPVLLPGDQKLYFGYPPAVDALRLIPVVQGVALILVLTAIVILVRQRVRTQRELVWAGMARESAHQIGTPLSSLSGWLELLTDRVRDEVGEQAVRQMQVDLERLDRVARRFERIGRPPRRDDVDISALVSSVASYFRARAPSLAHKVRIETVLPDAAAHTTGDAVLLEWALEALLKNSLDALAGRNGEITLSVNSLPEGGVSVRVQDSGPGVLREHRSHIFSPGFSTKEHGWGVGLALARRIVVENHGGTLTLLPGDSGATFEILLPG